MTVFRTRSDRAIARSRGHLRQAEEFVRHEAPFAAQFSISKATHALHTGMLHEAARAAEAHEIRTCLEILRLDPESQTGELFTSAQIEAVENKVIQYVRKITEAVEDDDE